MENSILFFETFPKANSKEVANVKFSNILNTILLQPGCNRWFLRKSYSNYLRCIRINNCLYMTTLSWKWAQSELSCVVFLSFILVKLCNIKKKQNKTLFLVVTPNGCNPCVQPWSLEIQWNLNPPWKNWSW